MNIQIGMSCDPQWLCDGIEIFLGLLILAATFGLLSVIRREVKANKEKKRRK